MNKKPMSSVNIKVNLMFTFASLLAEVIIVSDMGVPKNTKIICSCIFLPIIAICLIIFIADFVLRKKLEKKQIPIVEEKEEIISADEWNYNQRIEFPGERRIHDKEIDDELGENRTFIKKTDKYGNVVLNNINNNIVDWFIAFIFGNAMNIVALVSFFYDKSNIVGILVVLLIFVPFTIYSLLQINRIRKLKLKIKFFQIVKFIFMLSIVIFVLTGIFIIITKFNIEKIDVEKIIMFLFGYVMFIGFFAFICQMVLAVNAKIIKKIK